MTINDVKLIELPKFADPRGNLSFVEQNNHIPFEIKRTYWIYDVPGGEDRGGHAYKTTDEFIIAIAGAFDVIIDEMCNCWRDKEAQATGLDMWKEWLSAEHK